MTTLFTALIGVAAMVIAAGVGYPLTAWVLRAAARPAADAGATEESGEQLDPADVLRGGTWIGVLERIAITGAILVGYPAAIAVVIGVKGLGRFPELNAATGVSERFIIGTLASCLWAAAIGVAARVGVDALL